MLSKFPNSTLKLNAPVSLSPEHDSMKGPSNPVGMIGRVVQIGVSRLGVQWDNGASNTYLKEAYDLIAEGEPGFMET